MRKPVLRKHLPEEKTFRLVSLLQEADAHYAHRRPAAANSTRTMLTRNMHDTDIWYGFVQNGSINFGIVAAYGRREQCIP
jgi:hypothetical protein